MTLLVAALVPDNLILVSDQRLTDADTGELRTDRANKAIADLRTGTAWAFTGLAKVRSRPTDEWIMEGLQEGVGLSDAMNRVRDRGTTQFRWLPVAQAHKRLLAVGAGWRVLDSGTGEVEPYFATISNFQGEDRWLSEARDRFDVNWIHPLRRLGLEPSESHRGVVVMTLGQEVGADRQRKFSARLARSMERNSAPAIAARLIAEEVRSFADHNKLVGKGLLAITIRKPREGLTEGIFSIPPPWEPTSLADYFNAPAEGGSMSFVYIPRDISAPESVAYMPLVLSDGYRIRGGVVKRGVPWPDD